MIRATPLAVLLAGCQLVFEPPVAFDLAGCPAGYIDIPTLEGSRYRVEPNVLRSWSAAAADCADDSPEGFTHLFAPQTGTELGTLALQGQNLFFWIGGARELAAPEPIDTRSYRLVTGEPFPESAWAFGEPNNGGQGGGFAEAGAVLRPDGSVNDEQLSNGHELMCECDGLAVVPFDHQL